MSLPAVPDGLNSADRITLIRQMVEEYLRREGAGGRLSDDSLLEQHSELMPELAEELRKRRLIAKALHDARGSCESSACDDAITPFRSEGGRADEPKGLPEIPEHAVVAKLGEGGMGVVYRAWQDRPGRWVALKLMQPGEDLDRFEDEMAVLGRQEHPHIVKVFACGEHEGRPYFTMEYADGGSMDRVLAGAPQLATQAARLVELLARAVHHAHQQRVVHRDLKPGNVLLVRSDRPEAVRLGRDPEQAESYEPKVSDFGLAKQLDQPPGNTPSGARIGTPSYMAPEQADGRSREVGPAADIYALGAILYELLTGRPPFRGAGLMDTLLQVAHEEPVPPRRLQPRVPRDLETICLKCLAKAPTRRYASAGALAEDLRRFLAGEPIEARPVGVWEQGWNWVRRHPGIAGLAASAATVLLAVAGVAATRAVLSEQGRRAVQEERDEKERQREKAARARDRTRQALDAMTSAVTSKSLETQSALSAEQKKFLAEVLTYYQEFADEQGEDEGTRRWAADAAIRVGIMQSGLGNSEASIRAWKQARKGYERLAADFPAVSDYRQELATTYNAVGVGLARLGRRAEAEASHRRALELRERLAAEHPAAPQYRDGLAKDHNNLGALLAALGRWAEAEASYRRALELRERLAAEHPTVPSYRTGLAGAQVNLGHLLGDSGNPTQALAWYDRAIALLTPLVEAEPRLSVERRWLRNAHSGRATTLEELERHADAVPDWDQAVELSLGGYKSRMRALRARSLVRAGQVERGTAEAADLMKVSDGEIPLLLDLARVYALAAGKDEANSEDYIKVCLDLLRRAVGRGFKDAAYLKKDNDLKLLRDHVEFKKLLAELEGK